MHRVLVVPWSMAATKSATTHSLLWLLQSTIMVYVAALITDIDRMPRGGPDASCLDRLLQTDVPEYLDRDDVADGTKRSVIRALEWTGEFFGNTERFAKVVLDEVA